MFKPLLLNNKPIKPHKSHKDPLIGSRNVLTNSPWEFVTLWLKKEKKEKALFFWEQAHIFANASNSLPVQSAPLLHYYSFMNMVKALLISKEIGYSEIHGIKAHNLRGVSSKINLSNEGISILHKGILPALSLYLNESATETIYSLEELLYNIPCVHRTFCLTYKTNKDLFMPLTQCDYSYDTENNNVYLVAKVTSDFIDKNLSRILPQSFELVGDNSKGEIISKSYVQVSNPLKLTESDILQISLLNNILRKDLQYINGATTLWYLKGVRTKPKRIDRYPLTMILAIMHRLSELCRYKPFELSTFLNGQQNWLLSEFINMTPKQFLDEIASEITGYQFLIPNIRQAS